MGLIFELFDRVVSPELADEPRLRTLKYRVGVVRATNSQMSLVCELCGAVPFLQGWQMGLICELLYRAICLKFADE